MKQNIDSSPASSEPDRSLQVSGIDEDQLKEVAIARPTVKLGPKPDFDKATIKSFHAAAAAGELPKVQSLLEQGVSVDYQSINIALGRTALMTALKNDQIQLAEYLIAQGADINAKANLGLNALMAACYEAKTEVVEFLLSHSDIDLLQVAIGNKTTFDMARESGQADILKKLERHYSQLPKITGPEHYLVINFMGRGGGGILNTHNFENHERIAGFTAVERSSADVRSVKELVEKWMKFDHSQGGPRSQSLISIGSSWGAKPSQQIAKWFFKKYGFQIRMNAIIDGANIVGLPHRSIGPAEICKNYHIEGWHWPRGAAIKGADNTNLGDLAHDWALVEGAGLVEQEILKILEAAIVREA